ncbi:hypothetical protein BMETH_1241_0 [methanotrophic bacterial endosymbiont of Bathymodiolus sp.]|nr:hypothetical protein BMETH_1241_0 [methanotrophic bacterial endosymbiont of Bathymodiolus sp.]
MSATWTLQPLRTNSTATARATELLPVPPFCPKNEIIILIILLYKVIKTTKHYKHDKKYYKYK